MKAAGTNSNIEQEVTLEARQRHYVNENLRLQAELKKWQLHIDCAVEPQSNGEAGVRIKVMNNGKAVVNVLTAADLQYIKSDIYSIISHGLNDILVQLVGDTLLQLALPDITKTIDAAIAVNARKESI